jgi:hypothetical protein
LCCANSKNLKMVETSWTSVRCNVKNGVKLNGSVCVAISKVLKMVWNYMGQCALQFQDKHKRHCATQPINAENLGLNLLGWEKKRKFFTYSLFTRLLSHCRYCTVYSNTVYRCSKVYGIKYALYCIHKPTPVHIHIQYSTFTSRQGQ